MNFRTEMQDGRYVVAFGEGSFAAPDHLGLLDRALMAKHPLDRGFHATAVSILNNAARLARMRVDGPYGRKDSAKRRKLCDLIAASSNDLEALQP